MSENSQNRSAASARVKVRLCLASMLSVVVLFGALANRLLYQAGVESLVLRHFCTMCASYCFFLFTFKFWLRFLHGDASALKQAEEKRLRDLAQPQSTKSSSSQKWWRWLDVLLWPPDDLDTVLLLIPILVAFGLFMWIGAEGTSLLIDAAFDSALSAGLIRVSKDLSQSHLYANLWRRTFALFLAILAVGLITMHFAETTCPGQNRFSSVVRQCWMARK